MSLEPQCGRAAVASIAAPFSSTGVCYRFSQLGGKAVVTRHIALEHFLNVEANIPGNLVFEVSDKFH
jgi:hypothetical protein